MGQSKWHYEFIIIKRNLTPNVKANEVQLQTLEYQFSIRHYRHEPFYRLQGWVVTKYCYFVTVLRYFAEYFLLVTSYTFML